MNEEYEKYKIESGLCNQAWHVQATAYHGWVAAWKAATTPRPIETAPGDGIEILIHTDYGWEEGINVPVDISGEKRTMWVTPKEWFANPTHWLPLPPKPLEL
jgi:hypothetical protein